MASVYISLSDDDSKPSAKALTLDDTGRSFINLRVANGLNITLHGYNHDAVTTARDLAAELTVAATVLAERLHIQEASRLEKEQQS